MNTVDNSFISFKGKEKNIGFFTDASIRFFSIKK